MSHRVSSIKNLRIVTALRGEALRIDLGQVFEGTLTAWMKRDPDSPTYREFDIESNRYLVLPENKAKDYYTASGVLISTVKGKWFFDVEQAVEGEPTKTIFTGTIWFENDVTGSSGDEILGEANTVAFSSSDDNSDPNISADAALFVTEQGAEKMLFWEAIIPAVVVGGIETVPSSSKQYWFDRDSEQWVEMLSSASLTSPTGLEAINEGNGIGWRLVGRNPANFGNIGLNAIDLSNSTGSSITRGATGEYSAITGGFNNIASGYSSVVGGNSNEASNYSSIVAGGSSSTASGMYATISGGLNNDATEQNSTVSGGQNNIASGRLSTVLGGSNNTAPSWGEVVGGMFSTTYTPVSVTTFNAADRLFNIGNGTGTGSRRDAFTIYKNGAALFHPIDKATVTNAQKGMIIYDSVDDVPKYYNGLAWVNL